MVTVQILCVVTSPYGRAGVVRSALDTPRLRAFVARGVLAIMPDPEPAPDAAAEGEAPARNAPSRVTAGGAN